MTARRPRLPVGTLVWVPAVIAQDPYQDAPSRKRTADGWVYLKLDLGGMGSNVLTAPARGLRRRGRRA